MSAGGVPFPQIDTPFVEAGGTVTYPWYRFLVNLWQRTGAGMALPPNAVILLDSNGTPPVQAFDAITGELIGTVPLSGSAGGPAQPQTLAASPFVFTAGEAGTLTVFGGQIELSRDHGLTYYLVSLTGGPVPLLKGDKVQVTWFSTQPPSPVIFFPGT